VAGGIEVMSRVPLGATRQGGFPYGPAVMARYDNFEFNQGEGAELIAERWGFSRQQLDEYSSRSHELAAAAIDAGAFDEQVVPVTVPDVDGDGTHEFNVDEGLAILMTRMIGHMRDKGLRYGLQAMCEGGGTANASLLELV
jgi:acetyl-CoA acyltransferase